LDRIGNDPIRRFDQTTSKYFFTPHFEQIDIIDGLSKIQLIG